MGLGSRAAPGAPRPRRGTRALAVVHRIEAREDPRLAHPIREAENDCERHHHGFFAGLIEAVSSIVGLPVGVPDQDDRIDGLALVLERCEQERVTGHDGVGVCWRAPEATSACADAAGLCVFEAVMEVEKRALPAIFHPGPCSFRVLRKQVGNPFSAQAEGSIDQDGGGVEVGARFAEDGDPHHRTQVVSLPRPQSSPVVT